MQGFSPIEIKWFMSHRGEQKTHTEEHVYVLIFLVTRTMKSHVICLRRSPPQPCPKGAHGWILLECMVNAPDESTQLQRVVPKGY